MDTERQQGSWAAGYYGFSGLAMSRAELPGHDDPEAAALYHDSRGSEWVRINVTV